MNNFLQENIGTSVSTGTQSLPVNYATIALKLGRIICLRCEEKVIAIFQSNSRCVIRHDLGRHSMSYDSISNEIQKYINQGYSCEMASICDYETEIVIEKLLL